MGTSSILPRLDDRLNRWWSLEWSLAMRLIEIPGDDPFRLDHLVLDLNGTLSDRGVLLPGVAERIALLARDLRVHLVTADTFGSAAELGKGLALSVTVIASGDEKAAYVSALGAGATIAIGNGRNDEAMLSAARLGIAIIGPEGAAAGALRAADIVCRSVTDALDLLIDERLLIATLRP
jgi:soluble P-type ATPase